ncbi:MAG: tetratricopeptide repeat protein [Deltaproteobacteria bacterium]|nr:tetratricopeptide repeat protein [Deltaproteobacteria bacterium]
MTTNKDKTRANAQKFLQKGQIDKAIKEFQHLVEEDPKDVRTLLKIGDLQTRIGDHAAATKTYDQVAQFYADQGFFLKAVAVYKQILKIDPALVEVNVKLADLYHQLGLLSDASNQYRQISQIYEKLGKVEESIQVLRKMVELDPENVASRIKLAELLAKQNQVDEARHEFQSAATFLKTHHRVDDYIKVAERIVHFDPSDLATTRELANIYIQKKDARRALAKLQVCFKADPKDAETLALLANAFRDLGQIPKTVSVYKELAHIYRESGQTDAYQGVMRKVLDLVPDDAEALAVVGDAAPMGEIEVGVETQGEGDSIEVDASELDLDTDVVDQPDQGAAVGTASGPAPELTPAAAGDAILRILTEVDVYVKYGLKPKAIEHIQKVFEIDPEHREARTKLKDLYIDTQEPRAAARELWLLAGVAYRNGFTDTARDDLEELLGIDPEHSEARELLQAIAPETTGKMSLADVTEQAVSPALGYQPSSAAAEIDLDAEAESAEPEAGTELLEAEPFDELDEDRPNVAALIDEPLEVEEGAPQPTAVVSGESHLPTSRERPSAVMGARTQSMVNLTMASESGSSALNYEPEPSAAPPTPAPAAPRLAPKGERTSPPKADALVDDLDALLASAVPTRRAPTLAAKAPVAPAKAPTSVAPAKEPAAPSTAGRSFASIDAELDDLGLSPPTATAALDRAPAPADEPETPETAGPIEAAAPAETTAPVETTASLEAAEPVVEPAPATPVAEATAADGPDTTDLTDELEEVSFYRQQGLEDEAKDALAALVRKHPTHAGVLALQAELEAPPPAVVSTPAPAPSAPSGDLESEPEPEPEPEPVSAGTHDLAAELASDLNAAAAVDDFQVSFTDVFDEFKKGVAEQVDASDYDTHYNLGIAYKEMGLLADAIREFEVAVVAAGRHIGALTMVGLCYLELGNTERSMDAFLRGLNDPQVTAEEAMALRFEVGAAYESMGRFREAGKFYEKVAAMDPKFRDVGERLKATERQAASQTATATDELDALLEDSPPAKPKDVKAAKISYL